MPHVVFVVPYARENTLRFVRAAASLPGVRLSVVSQDPAERFDPSVRELLVGFQQVKDALDADPLTDGVRAAARQLGGLDCLLGILEPLQEALGTVRQRLQVRGMDHQTARNFRDKAIMKEVLREHGLPCARHRLCASLAEAREFAAQSGFPVVAKPPAGAGAKTTARIEDDAQLASFFATVRPSAKSPMLLEEFVQGREFSFDSVSLRTEHVFHSISEYHPTPLHVMENPWIQWAVVLPQQISGPEFHPIRQAGPAALRALGMVTGLTHMEWFRRPDGSIAISEVAARPPGAQFMTLMSYAHDTDMYRAWAELMVFDRFTPPVRRYAAGAAYLRGQGRGKVVAVHGLDEVRQKVAAVVVEAKLPQSGQAPAGSYEGEGYVVVRHPETKVVEQALATIVATLRVELG